jgi:hypothetical protein
MGRPRIDRDDLIAELRRVDGLLSDDLRRKDMDEHGKYSAQTYANRFGSWSDAVDAAGITTERADSSPVSDSDLLDALLKMNAGSEGRPTTSQMDEEGPYTARTYRRRFGSWKQALEEAEIDTDERVGTGGHLTDEQRRDALMELTEMLGRPPSSREMEKCGRYGATTYEYQYGSWNEALEFFGLDPAFESVEDRKKTSGDTNK